MDHVAHELLLCCARTQLSESMAHRIRHLLKQQVDWDYLFALARRHSLLPLLYSSLQRSDIPPAKLAWLKQQFQDNAARNLLLTAELCRLIARLKDEGIEAVPYKGPALAVYAYGDLSLRRFIDLDLLLKKDDVLKARDVLLALGYRGHPAWSGSGEKLLLHTQHNLPLKSEDGRLIVELHWEVAPELFASLSEDDFWQRLEPLTLNGMPVNTMSAEDLLLSLCVHGSKHLWERLAWICDIAELLRVKPDINWGSVLDQAEEGDLKRMLGLGLHLADNLLQAPVPLAVSRTYANDSTIKSLADRVKNRLFDGAEQRPSGLSEVLSFNLRARQDLRSRIRYCRFAFMPTDADLAALRLPHSMRFVYYIMRPFRLMGAARFSGQ